MENNLLKLRYSFYIEQNEALSAEDWAVFFHSIKEDYVLFFIITVVI